MDSHILRMLTSLQHGNYLEILSIVEDDGFDVNSRINYRYYNTAIEIALDHITDATKRNAFVKTLLNMGADPNALLDKENDTLIDRAIRNDDLALFETALSDPRTRAAIDVRRRSIKTPWAFAK